MAASAAVHPSDQTLQSYGLGKLNDLLAEAVGKHLGECDACRRRVAEVTSDSFVGRLQNAQARPETAPPVGSSLAGLSKLDGEARQPSPPPADTLPPGLAEHPDYQVLRELGRGGMGVVYLAENRMMGRKEVLKVVSSHLLNRKGVLERFLREIRSAAQLHHPNIVTAYSATRVGESIVFAMQYVEGYDLSKLVEKSGPLAVAHACNFVYQAALGLQHAHEHGMVHRDIKPSNLMLARDGNKPVVKVLDFGLAKVTSEGVVDVGLTQEGQMLGTPHYIAPEQTVSAQKADIRADIYSLGCTLYCLLTGHPPFDAPSLYELLQAHHSMDAKPLNFIRPEVPAELAAVLAKMLAKEPERRFQTPAEVALALAPFFKKGNVASTRSKPEFSQAGPPDAKQATAGAGSVPARPAAELQPAPAPSVGKPVETPRPEATWKSLVDFKETEPVKKAAPAAASNRRPPWLWPAVAVGVLLLGSVALWGVLIRIWTPEGFIVLKDLPDQAVVIIDDKKATVHWPDGGGPAEIAATPGDHMVQVKKDGFTMKGQTVTVKTGDKTTLTVQLEPLETPTLGKDGADKAEVKPSDSTLGAGPPIGAVVLFSGASLDGWVNRDSKPAEWPVTDGVLTVGRGDIMSVRRFGNFQLHLEFEVPYMPEARGQARGNSGVFLDGMHELQILDSYGLKPQDNECGAIYKRIAPSVNACKPPLQWQTYDVTFHKAKVDRAKVVEKARVTVVQNGLTIIDNVATTPTPGGIDLKPGEDGPILLQDHGNRVEYRNIWIKPLETSRPGKDEAQDSPRSEVNKQPIATSAERTGIEPDGVQASDLARSPNRKASILSGSWRVEENELVQNGGQGTILLGEMTLSSFDLKFQGKIVSGDEGFVALFHRTSGDNVRFFHVGELGGKRVDLGFLCEGKEGGQSKPIATAKGRWYNVLIKVRSAEFWCYLDGQELFHDVDKRFARGRIGLATWDANARYRDIVITTPEGKVLWEGLPDLPGQPGVKVDVPAGVVGRPDAIRRPTDTKVFNGKHYKVFPQQLTWHEAKVRCQELGGHLAIVTSEKENRFLTSLVKEQGLGGAWLGATDEEVEGRWIWVNNTPLRYSNWDIPQKQPNNKQGIEHYMVLLTRFNGTWCDQPNDGRQEHPGFVCQWD